MKRLATAMAAFAALSVIAAFVLHGTALVAVLILFGYFAVRTLIAHKMRAQAEEDSDPIQDESSQSETSGSEHRPELRHQ